MKTITGFDYRTGTEVKRSARDWRDTVTADLGKGMRRRVEAGETFVHAGAVLQYEIYVNVAPRA